jgi:chromosome condensin MukBEF ATPase and DNA-binding subunit MukB
MFHVSLLRKAKIDPSRVLPQVPMKIKGDLTMKAKLVKILDRDQKVLRNKRVPLVRVLWRSSRIEQETRERESEMKEKFPHLFFDIGT